MAFVCVHCKQGKLMTVLNSMQEAQIFPVSMLQMYKCYVLDWSEAAEERKLHASIYLCRVNGTSQLA